MIIGLALLPATFLTGCFWNGKQITLPRILMFGAFYNGGFAAFLILRVISMNVTESHPLAFSIAEQFYSMLIAIVAAMNTWVLWRRRRRITRAHDA
jgi:hypothetical protein